jgi:hypothetical protein
MMNIREPSSSTDVVIVGAYPVGLTELRLAARLAIPLLLLGTSVGFARAPGPNSPERQGRVLAERMCAACHAVGRSGRSPHISAPAFRQLDRRVDLDAFNGAVAGGPHGRPSRYADVSLHPRGCPHLRLIFEIDSSALNPEAGTLGEPDVWAQPRLLRRDGSLPVRHGCRP